MSVRACFVVDVAPPERVIVSRIRGERPVVLEIHRCSKTANGSVTFVELTVQQAQDVREALDRALEYLEPVR